MSGTSSETALLPPGGRLPPAYDPYEIGFVGGYQEAERHLYRFGDGDDPNFGGYLNPFEPGTPAHKGYEEGVYDFTQK